MILTIEDFWKKKGFKPTDSQREAILHTGSPLFLTAGPGSGKTRVLLWRTFNLLVYHGIKPEEIFLSTFTEKASLQLKDGLRTYLALATNELKKPFDISKMAIGTVHSICNSIISNREFSPDRTRVISPKVLDELSQYLFLYNKNNWIDLISVGGFKNETEAQREINFYLEGKSKTLEKTSSSRHDAVVNSIKLFNRFSEEHVQPDKIKTKEPVLKGLVKMYAKYLAMLRTQNKRVNTVDLSLLQQEAYRTILSQDTNRNIYKHIIIDEYQDTNVIQEKLFFELAKGHKNLCVVGDDDQALYRFRGATVENLVEFKDRCKVALGIKPHQVSLTLNFRSKKKIIDTYNQFIQITDWKKEGEKGFYRVQNKTIQPGKTDNQKSIFVTSEEKPLVVGHEIAELIKRLKHNKKINDYNEVAILFPAMKNNAKVRDLKISLEQNDIPVYAPRAGRFLEVPESEMMFGLFQCVFGRPPFNPHASGNMKGFQGWLTGCYHLVEEMLTEDKQLKAFVTEKKKELEAVLVDYDALMKFIGKKKWNEDDIAKPDTVSEMAKTSGISEKCKKALNNHFFRELVKSKYEKANNPFKIKYVINRVTSVDWSVLDLFYRLCGFQEFKKMFDLAEDGTDEGPICNLALTSQYIARFTETYPSVITGRLVSDDRFVKLFFNSYLYALYRLQESEYENPDDPFPKGRVPFLTVHQSKGLEFPVVIMGSVFRKERPAGKVETIIREYVRDEGEPLDKIGLFDNMRMFYVGLSRAKNLLVLPRYKGATTKTDEFRILFEKIKFPELKSLKIEDLPDAEKKEDDLGGSYSFTGDYLQYHKCPRQYMIFKKYGFVPSRSQTMFFGSLVHKTIEDLHNFLIHEHKKPVLQ